MIIKTLVGDFEIDEKLGLLSIVHNPHFIKLVNQHVETYRAKIENINISKSREEVGAEFIEAMMYLNFWLSFDTLRETLTEEMKDGNGEPVQIIADN